MVPSEVKPSRLLHKGLWSAGATLCVLGAMLVNSILVARLLGPEGTGQTAYFTWLASFVLTLANLGIPQAVQWSAASLRARQEHQVAQHLEQTLARVFGVALAIAVGASAIVSVRSGRSTAQSGLFAAYLLGSGLTLFLTNYLSGLQEFRLVAGVTALGALIQSVALAIGASVGGVTGALWAYTLATIPGSVLYARLILKRRDGLVSTHDVRRDLLRFSGQTWIAGILSSLVWSRLEIWFLERYWGHATVGMFTVGLSLALLAIQGPLLFSNALAPHFAELHGSGAGEALRQAYQRLTRLLGVALIPSCILCSAATPVVLPWLFGQRFIEAVPNAMIVVAFAFVGASARAGSAVLQGTGRSQVLLTSNLIGGSLMIVSGLTLVRLYGAVGAAWTRSLLQSAVVAYETWYLVRVIRMPLPWRSLAAILVLSVPPGGILWILPAVCRNHATAMTLALLPIMVAGVWSAAWLVGIVPQADRAAILDLIGGVVRRIRSRD